MDFESLLLFHPSFWPDLYAISFIYHFKFVKSYGGGQTAVEKLRIIDDYAFDSPIATHLREQDNKPLGREAH